MRCMLASMAGEANVGKCDEACDNINCQFDGGDCLDERPEELDLTDSKRPTYAASLDYVNIKFNEHFGRRRRYNVPHIPMLVEKQIMLELQDIFRAEYDMTSSHKTRHKNKMQYEFAYVNYVHEEWHEKVSFHKSRLSYKRAQVARHTVQRSATKQEETASTN